MAQIDLQKTTDIDITVININAIKINGKCVVKTGNGDWVKQMAPYTDKEIEAIKHQTRLLDESRKNL